jgi:hypothetical protein
MSSNRPDPGEFIERAQQVLRDLFAGASQDADPWAAATRSAPSASRGAQEPSAARQRENLTFALATRAVEALEDVALNVAAIRQRLERVDGETARARPGSEDGGPGGADAAGSP